MAAHKGKWIELTPDQWEFLRGIYAMNPLTPPGLPYGDKAALAKVDGEAGGIVYFPRRRQRLHADAGPRQAPTMMDDVATAKISHEGNGL